MSSNVLRVLATFGRTYLMSHALYRLGRFAARRPWIVIGAWLLVSIVVIGASGQFGRELESNSAVPGLDSQAAIDLLSSARSDTAGLTAEVVMTPLAGSTFSSSPGAADSMTELRDAVTALPHVLDTSEPAISPDDRVALIRVQYPVVTSLTPEDLARLNDAVATARLTAPLQIETAGDLFAAFAESETGTSELLGLMAAVVILLLAFGSVVAMGLPIGIALFGLALGVSSMSLITYVIGIPRFAPQMAAMIGLAVGIDYALFLVTRHREFLAQGLTVEESVGRAVATAGQAVIFAGATVVIAILGLSIAGVPFMTAAGVATSVIVLIMVIASVTLLPAFLGLAGHSINRFGIHWFGRRRSGTDRQTSTPGPTISPRWLRWGQHVSNHAWRYTIGGSLLLVALAVPVLTLRLGFPDGGTLPESRTERRAYDLLADGFGPGVNGPLLIAVDISRDSSVVEPLVSAIRADRGVASVAPPDINRAAGVATIIAIPVSAPQDDATVDTIARLRHNVFPAVLAGSPSRAHVGGQTASFSDIGDKVSDRLPWFISAVVLLSFLLLTIVFRSVVVPLKAALLNLLSIGAAYGVLVMVFQWGWGIGLIGAESTAPIDPFIPLFMFAVLFGLSMDYEVFLLSRVREEYLVTRDNDSSVIHGIASTARVITSAALIMIFVFLGFVLGEEPSSKMVGLGLATAIFVDATIIRMVLVPATMKLMGAANWWIPTWLDRLLPTIDIEGGFDEQTLLGDVAESGDSPDLAEASVIGHLVR